jgi:hypothetical protein
LYPSAPKASLSSTKPSPPPVKNKSNSSNHNRERTVSSYDSNLSAPAPCPRHSHSAVAYAGSLIVFGGVARLSPSAPAVAARTEQVTGDGRADLPRHLSCNESDSDSAEVIDDREECVVHTAVQDVWVFAADKCRWVEVRIRGSRPSARYSHAACVANHTMVVHGGRGAGSTDLLSPFNGQTCSDMWALPLRVVVTVASVASPGLAVKPGSPSTLIAMTVGAPGLLLQWQPVRLWKEGRSAVGDTPVGVSNMASNAVNVGRGTCEELRIHSHQLVVVGNSLRLVTGYVADCRYMDSMIVLEQDSAE